MPVHLEHLEEKTLSDFLLGRLDDLEQTRVEKHLETCVECELLAAALTPRDDLIELVSSTKPESSQLDAFFEKQPVKERSDQVTHVSSRDSTSVLSSLPFDSSREDFVKPEPVAKESQKHDFKIPLELQNHPRYRIIRPLGRGGMGIVWLAQHLMMNRLVALKVIRWERLKNPDAVERFRREVHAAAKLHHPNVVAAYDADQIGETHFLVVEYVDGATLSELIELGPLTIVEACSAIRDAARGLAHAHQQGLVHRDVKPGNLIRDREGTVKVLDFGLVVIPNEDSSITGANMVVGTPDYVAPEQAVDPRDADARSDIYSLGCSLYHLITGSPPFPKMPLLKKLDAHRFNEPMSLSEMRASHLPVSLTASDKSACSQVPSGLQKIVSNMMAKLPEQRYQMAEEIVDALSPYCEPQNDAMRSSASRLSAAVFRRRNAIMVGLGSLGILAIFQRHRFFIQTPPIGPMTLKSPTPESNIDVDRIPEKPIRGTSYLMFVPTTIGDGTRKDFRTEENVLYVDSLTRNRQVWLNFKFFESKRFLLKMDVRFPEIGRSPILKFALLSDYGMEYNVQICRMDRRNWLFVKKESQGVSQILAKHELAEKQLSEWSNFEILVDNRHLMVYLAEKMVIDCVCDVVVDRYPAICVNDCTIELRDPVVARIE